MTAGEFGLVAVARAFAWSMGAHYTGDAHARLAGADVSDKRRRDSSERPGH